jgi:hypothetical protein
MPISGVELHVSFVPGNLTWRWLIGGASRIASVRSIDIWR